jgi:outer membrane protein OmpA-like peptidoglycan-associated protein
MRWLVALSLFMTVAVSAASTASAREPAGHRFPVFFAPMTAKLDHGGTRVISSAAKFAEEYKDKPITLVAYSSPPGHHYVEPADIDTERAQAVTAQLIADGVNKDRIHVIARGPVQPKIPMSHIEVRRVDIIVGTASTAR